MHFDPITGEKIMDPGDEIQGQAGQAADQAAQAATQAAQTADQAAAQTAQAAGDTVAQAQQVYDQTQAAQAAATQQAQGQFQQAQGQFQQAQGQFQQAQGQFQQAQGQFQQAQPQFQQMPSDGNKVKKGLPVGAVIGIIVGVVAVIGIIVFAATKFMGGKLSLLTFGATAYDGSYLVDAIKETGFKPYEDMSVTVNAEVEDLGLNVVAARKADSHVGSVYAEITYSGFTANATGYIDEKKIEATCPVIGDYLFVYDYSSSKNSGYIIEMLEDEGIDAEDLNAMIGFLNDNSDNYRKLSEKMIDYYKDCIEGIELEKTGKKETFTVNGKDVSCKEYKAVITEDDVNEWIKGYQEILEGFVDDNSDVFDAIESLSGESFDLDDSFDELYDEIEDMDDIEFMVYAKGTTVAAICLTNADDEEVQILFKGGDYLAQNVEVTVDGDTTLTIEGKIDGDVETSTIETDDMTIEYSYNRKTGELTIENDDFEFNGKLVCKKGEMTITVDSVEVDGDDLEIEKLEIIYSSKVDIKEPKGEEFDIGNADEDDLSELGEEIYDNVYDNDELMDFLEEFMYMF